MDERKLEFFGDFLLKWETFDWGLRSFASIALVALGVALLCFIPVLRISVERRQVLAVIGALFVMGIFGGLVGFQGGNSRIGVVGDLMPAVVALVAGIAAYLFGVSERPPGPLLFPLLASFVSTLFIAYGMGSVNRGANDEYATWEGQCLSVFGNPDVLGSERAYRNAKEHFGDYCDGAF